MHYFAFDTETTGLEWDVVVAENTTKHEILQIGALLLDNKLNEIASGKINLMPERWEDAAPIALQVNKVDPKTWEPSYTSTKTAMEKMNAWIDQHIKIGSKIECLGHNIPFDIGFLKPLIKKHGQVYKFGYHPVDTMSMYWVWGQVFDKSIRSYKLERACAEFGIEFGGKGVHDAMSDIRATVALARAIRNNIRAAIKDGSSGLRGM